MKCQNCGAEVGNNKFCEFCGTQITLEMKKEQEQLNKQGCPKCGSGNVSFKRENQGEIRGKNSKQVVHRTVGVCGDCGETWFVDEAPKKKKTWLWVLGWIFIFPLPLTIILVRKKDMNKYLKYGIIAVAWILYVILAFSGGSSESTTNNIQENTSILESTTVGENEVIDETTTEAVVETTTEAVPAEYKSALRKAQSYSDNMNMSKKGLYEQLTSEYGEQFSDEAAQYAIDNVNADWKENALAKARSYQENLDMSPAAIHDQLTSEYGEQFTEEEADYAIEHLND